MKVVDKDLDLRIHFSMTWEEAQLIYDVTDGYVALARTLTKEVSTRFPEPKEHYEALFSKLREGIGEHLRRCKETQQVFEGRAVAIDSRELERLRERSLMLAEIEKAGPKP